MFIISQNKKGYKLKTLKTYATSLTALIFLVIGVSGVMLFFHLGESYVKELHEILGLAFVAVVLLHVVANWTLMQKYFTKKVFLTLGVVVAVVSAGFVYQGTGKSGVNPKMYIIKTAINKPFSQVAEFLDVDKTTSINALKEKGYKINMAKTIAKNAKENKVSPFEIVSVMLAK